MSICIGTAISFIPTRTITTTNTIIRTAKPSLPAGRSSGVRLLLGDAALPAMPPGRGRDRRRRLPGRDHAPDQPFAQDRCDRLVRVQSAEIGQLVGVSLQVVEKRLFILVGAGVVPGVFIGSKDAILPALRADG